MKVSETFEDAPVPFLSVYQPLARAAHLAQGSMVHVVNVSTGARWVLPILFNDKEGSVQVHGVKNRYASRSENIYVEDTVIVMAYATLAWSPEVDSPAGVKPTVIVPVAAQEQEPVLKRVSGSFSSTGAEERSPSSSKSDSSENGGGGLTSSTNASGGPGSLPKSGSDEEGLSPKKARLSVLSPKKAASGGALSLQEGTSGMNRTERFNAVYSRLELEEATVNNNSNTAFLATRQKDFCFEKTTQTEYVSSLFLVNGPGLLEEGDALKKAIDLDIAQAEARKYGSSSGVDHDVEVKQNMSYLALPKPSSWLKRNAEGGDSGDEDGDVILPPLAQQECPWAQIRDLEMMHSLRNMDSV